MSNNKQHEDELVTHAHWPYFYYFHCFSGREVMKLIEIWPVSMFDKLIFMLFVI